MQIYWFPLKPISFHYHHINEHEKTALKLKFEDLKHFLVEFLTSWILSDQMVLTDFKLGKSNLWAHTFVELINVETIFPFSFFLFSFPAA